MAILELRVKNLTLPFTLATSISFETIGCHFWHIFDVFCAFDLVTLTFDLLTLAMSDAH